MPNSPGSPTPDQTGQVTELLVAWAGGNEFALEQLLPLVYPELRRMAGVIFRREREAHTLQPTALINEAFVKMVRADQHSFRDRSHFFAVASQAMRQILVDHARSRATAKRGSGATQLVLNENLVGEPANHIDVLAVDQALTRLADLDRDQAQLVELRFFGGLTIEEAAEVLGVSAPTVKRDWRVARAFLVRELGGSQLREEILS